MRFAQGAIDLTIPPEVGICKINYGIMTAWKQRCPIQAQEGQEQMARRSRRRRHSPSKANPRSFSELRANRDRVEETAAAAQPSGEPATPDQPSLAAPGQSTKGQADWNVEYGRVFSDLKQLLIVSAALFVLMLLVGLFL